MNKENYTFIGLLSSTSGYDGIDGRMEEFHAKTNLTKEEVANEWFQFDLLHGTETIEEDYFAYKYNFWVLLNGDPVVGPMAFGSVKTIDYYERDLIGEEINGLFRELKRKEMAVRWKARQEKMEKEKAAKELKGSVTITAEEVALLEKLLEKCGDSRRVW